MKNSADKQLREKLTGTEFPFDPQAWEQMEAMLDKKKKRGIFFWWWTGGIAAVLLLGVAMLTIDHRPLTIENTSAYSRSEMKQVGSGSRQVEAERNTIAAVGSGSRHGKAEGNTAVVGSGSMQEKSEGTVIAEATGNSKSEKIKSRKEKAQSRAVAMMRAKTESSSNEQDSKIRVNPSNPRHPRANVFSENKKTETLASYTTASSSAENIYLIVHSFSRLHFFPVDNSSQNQNKLCLYPPVQAEKRLSH